MRLTGFESIHNRHHDIQHDCFDVVIEDDRQRLGSVSGCDDVIALKRQSTLYRTADGAVVFDDENSMVGLIWHL